jgi:hypothetical protein
MHAVVISDVAMWIKHHLRGRRKVVTERRQECKGSMLHYEKLGMLTNTGMLERLLGIMVSTWRTDVTQIA